MASLENILNGPWSPPEPETLPPPEEQFRRAIAASGITPPKEIVFDAQLHRYPTSESGRDKAGWYVGFPDGIHAGAFGCWRSGVQSTFTETIIGRELAPAESMARAAHIKEAQEKARAIREQRAEITADTTASIWSTCQLASNEHPYLKTKDVKSHGAKVSGDGRLVLPLYNTDGELSTLQYIDAYGTKLFHSNGLTKGCFHLLGDFSDAAERIYIAEGFATAATIYEETGRPTVVAYSSNNLSDVTGTMRKRYPVASIIIVADNDKSGRGKDLANQAAAKHGVRVVMPPTVGDDANDYRAAGGDVRTLLSDGEGLTSERLQVVFGDEMPDAYEAPDEIVQDLLVARSLAVLYGSSNSGKTFWALSLAAAVSESEVFFGKEVDGGLVIYLASEAPGTIRQRMQAIRRHAGKGLSNLAMVPIPLNFYNGANDANSVIELCREIEEVKGQPVKLIVCDTLARMSSGANENSGEDMGPIMDRFDAVANATGAALLMIHHSGKNKAAGSRGWSGIQAHISTEIEVSDESGVRVAEVKKQRELPSKGVSINFDLEVVEMGIGKFGNNVTTCIAVPDERERTPKRDAKLSGYLKVIADAWASKSGEFVDDLPYITRSALRDYLVDNEVYAERTINNVMGPSAKRGLIFACLESGDIRERVPGLLIVAPDIIKTIGLMRDK